jgi:hypothetical protein
VDRSQRGRLRGRWCASTAIGVSVEDHFTVFGAAGAIVFTILSGVVLHRFAAARPQAA